MIIWELAYSIKIINNWQSYCETKTNKEIQETVLKHWKNTDLTLLITKGP